ncbi:MAG: phosphate ABC transporter substrate-binding protein [Akkermansiaceae bacterium]
MKYTALFAFGALLTGSAVAQDKIVMKGSDTLGAKMVPQLKEAYLASGKNVAFEIAAEGSSQAFTNLLAGTCNIGMSSRDVKSTEKDSFVAKGESLVEHVAAWDMIAVVVNKDNGVKNLTLKQVEGIFTGDITDWSEVGGKPGKISAYTRNTASGTYKTFQKLAMSKRDYGSGTQKMAGNEQIATETAGNVNGIGYVGLAYAEKEGLKAIKVEGVAPKPRKKADYPLSRKLYYYTVGEPKGAAADFIKWATTAEKANEVIEKVGFIAVGE